MGGSAPRGPDFVVIGTMKSGSTTLFHWLDSHPDVRMPAVKEPNLFSEGRDWQSRHRRYSRLFQGIPTEMLTGEASVRYTDPAVSAATALRMHQQLPDVRLVCLLRHPVARMQSHFRHEVQRGREARDFFTATAEFDGQYVRRSCYALALSPWLELYPRNQLFVATYESMFGESPDWDRLLEFLGLQWIRRPVLKYNVSAEKAAFSPLMSLLWRAGVAERLPRVPPSARAVARRVLFKPPTDPDVSRLLTSTDVTPHPEVLRLLGRQVAALRQMLPDVDDPWDIGRSAD